MQPYIGEIKIVSFGFAPRGWALANGQILPINQNQPLFALLGTMYGGNGQTTFALPDLRGRSPMHQGFGPGGLVGVGETGGEEGHALSVQEMPAHVHALPARNAPAEAGAGPGTNPAGAPSTSSFASSAIRPYRDRATATVVPLGSPSGTTGSGFRHQNMQPYLALNFIIALSGVFPSRN